MVADYAAIRTKKNGQFRTVNSDDWRIIAIALIDPGPANLNECNALFIAKIGKH
jgi:hypothetical protein